jgi:hypothetical protein
MAVGKFPRLMKIIVPNLREYGGQIPTLLTGTMQRLRATLQLLITWGRLSRAIVVSVAS